MIRGTFTDGKTATRTDVELTIATERGRKLMRINAPGVFAEWPIVDVRRVASASDEIRFRRGDGDARLTISAYDQKLLKTAAPELFSNRSRTLAAAGVAGLVLLAATTAGAIFFGAPLLSGPLARSTPTEVETTLGANSRELIGYISDHCVVDERAQAEAEDLIRRLGQVSNSPFASTLTFVDADFPNAFALPGGSIMVTDDLIDILDTPEQLAGVLAHETAHVARRHVMAAVIREIGGAMVLDLLVGGGSGAGQQIAMSGLQLQSLRHGRNAESEADELGIDYLIEIGVDPDGLAEFFDRIGEFTGADDQPRVAELLLTHPTPSKRADSVRELAATARAANPDARYAPAMSEEAWQALKEGCR